MMKSQLLRLVTIACLLVLLTTSDSTSVQERRIALVIGNGAYKSSTLANPVNDANDMATSLKKCNFTVMKSINATRKEMRRAIRSFGEEINKGAVGLFYYAGHGIQVDGENYLVPLSAEVYTEAEVEDECLKVSSVLRQMESAGNRLNIIILDACRDNPFGRSFRSRNTGLAKMDAPTGSILAYATAPGSIAIDGTGSNGLYTSMLLKHMMTPNLIIEKIFKRVRIDVVNASGKRQTPWESSSLMGDFYFNLKRGINVEDRTVTESESLEQEPPKYAALHPDDSMPYKLAIFPWKLNFQWTSYSRGFVMSIIIPSLNNTIDETKLFTPLFSYYEIDEEFSSKMISKDILGIDSVWEKKSFFSNYKPNINIISEIGKQLNIDAVLMFDMLITDAEDNIRAYLIDVKKKKIYYALAVTYIFRNEGDAEIKRITKKVFSAYKAEQKFD